jgi:hypothetical protein
MVADEIGVVKAANVDCKTPMERDIRKNDFGWETKGLSEEFVLKLFKAIHKESIAIKISVECLNFFLI